MRAGHHYSPRCWVVLAADQTFVSLVTLRHVTDVWQTSFSFRWTAADDDDDMDCKRDGGVRTRLRLRVVRHHCNPTNVRWRNMRWQDGSWCDVTHRHGSIHTAKHVATVLTRKYFQKMVLLLSQVEDVIVDRNYMTSIVVYYMDTLYYNHRKSKHWPSTCVVAMQVG